jgi:capsular polysaccharide export protein
VDEPFLRIPPFPGHRASPLATAGSTPLATEEAAEIARLLRDRRVGGNFWGSQPNLPAGRDLILAPASQAQALQMLEAAAEEQLLDRCILIDSVGLGQIGNAAPTITGNIDRWYIAEAASFIWADANHELALLAALCGSPIKLFSNGVVTDVADDQALAPWVGNAIGGWAYESPFDGRSITPFEAIELLSDWRRLIDRNRAISHVFGVAIWKRATVDPMLWNGTSLPRHSSEVPKSWAKGAVVAAWKSRTSQNLLNRVQISGLPVAEIEDGMIRGRGLGANCIPPLSIVVDFAGIYFDPAQPSDLEQLLETVDISEELADRAARLSRMIVDAGVSKYDSGSRQILRCSSVRRVLVLGQVEDDRSVLNGGPGQTNLGLLMQARKLEPDAWLVYRPHPDVEAGHRKGHVADAHILRFADEIERDSSITSLLDSVDGVHCITSLGGFEALLRGKDVTTHGVPFYAGWGLTNDLGPIPLRRRRRRNLDELVAATLILYPTYLDPVTRLPCSPEILVGRMADGEDGLEAPLAWLRSSQGRLKVALRRLWEAAE